MLSRRASIPGLPGGSRTHNSKWFDPFGADAIE
jgi:hypothetical protein